MKIITLLIFIPIHTTKNNNITIHENIIVNI